MNTQQLSKYINELPLEIQDLILHKIKSNIYIEKQKALKCKFMSDKYMLEINAIRDIKSVIQHSKDKIQHYRYLMTNPRNYTHFNYKKNKYIAMIECHQDQIEFNKFRLQHYKQQFKYY